MKKLTAVMAAIILASLTACAPQEQSTTTSANANASEAVTAVENAYNAAPETSDAASTTDTATYAEVKDVISNQLSLKILRGSFNAEEIAKRQSERGSGGSRPARTDENGETVTRGSRPAWTDENGETVTRGSREAMTNENGEPVSFEDMRYTGEEKDVIVPVGTPIKTIVVTDGKVEEKDSELSDIKNGSSVNIIYDGENIKEVQILPATRGGGRAFGGAGGSDGAVFIPGAGPNGGDIVINGAAQPGAVGG